MPFIIWTHPTRPDLSGQEFARDGVPCIQWTDGEGKVVEETTLIELVLKQMDASLARDTLTPKTTAILGDTFKAAFLAENKPTAPSQAMEMTNPRARR